MVAKRKANSPGRPLVQPFRGYTGDGSGFQSPIVQHLLTKFDLHDPEFMRTFFSVSALMRLSEVEVTPEMAEQWIRQIMEANAEVAEARAKVSVVYYMRMGNRVKIGTTTDIESRTAAIGPEEVVVTEPGDVQLERQRHKQFAELRVVGEWFKLREPLKSHIKALQAATRTTAA